MHEIDNLTPFGHGGKFKQPTLLLLAFNVTLTGNAEMVCAAKLTTVARGKVCKEDETNDCSVLEARW